MLIATRFRHLSAQDYLAEIKKDNHNIKSVVFVHPQNGKDGYFRIEYRQPVLIKKMVVFDEFD